MDRLQIIKRLFETKIDDIGAGKAVSKSFLEHGLYEEIKVRMDEIARDLGCPQVDEETNRELYDTVYKDYISKKATTINPANSLGKKETWLTEERRGQYGWHYSQRYFDSLAKKGRASSVLRENREACMDILERMGDPHLGCFFNKGLVVGSVQSGKTENFNGVINHAIDAGYRLIIVFSGIMEDLRSQTQMRVEEDVIGRGVINTHTGARGDKGVGILTDFSPQSSPEQVKAITSYDSDFSAALRKAASLDHLNILVCKKNVSVLKNLLIWLHEEVAAGETSLKMPLLIVDDEADNASLNNLGAKGAAYATKTNELIRALLGLFDRKSYLGYTATPFANVLADRNEVPETKLLIEYNRNGKPHKREFDLVDNLFPEDYIKLLNPPSNYIGAKAIFETVDPWYDSDEKLPLLALPPVTDHIENFPSRIDKDTGEGVEYVAGNDEYYMSSLPSEYGDWSDYKNSTRSSKRDDDFPKELPKSLKEAIACFIITVAIREARKPGMIHAQEFCPHHTMLVHVSRFIPWQNRTRFLIKEYVADFSARLVSDSPAAEDSIYKYFERMWYKYYAEIMSSITQYLHSKYNDPYLKVFSFKSILPSLGPAAENVEVLALNSHPDNKNIKLGYDKKTPRKVIAIGGNRLSRGFTMEGLTINYFIRSAGCADTLLQMGRWFGYRTGYIDCCKIFTTQELIDRFDQTTRTIEELEGQFRKMEKNNESPRSFEIRVRKHPGALKITRPSILKNTVKVLWSYQDSLVQETSLSVKNNDIKREWDSFVSGVVSDRKFSDKVCNGYWVADVSSNDASAVIDGIGPISKVDKKNIRMFIKRANKKDKLVEWRIAIKNTGEGRGLRGKESGLPFNIDNLAVRRGPRPNGEKHSRFRMDFINKKIFHATGRNRNIVSSGKDLAVFLSADEIREAEHEYREERLLYFMRRHPAWTESHAREKVASIKTIPERVYREKMSDRNGVILVYLLDTEEVFLKNLKKPDDELGQMMQEEGIDPDLPMVAYAIGFPPIVPDPGGEYLKGDYALSDEVDEDEADEDGGVLDMND